MLLHTAFACRADGFTQFSSGGAAAESFLSMLLCFTLQLLLDPTLVSTLCVCGAAAPVNCWSAPTNIKVRRSVVALLVMQALVMGPGSAWQPQAQAIEALNSPTQVAPAATSPDRIRKLGFRLILGLHPKP